MLIEHSKDKIPSHVVVDVTNTNKSVLILQNEDSKISNNKQDLAKSHILILEQTDTIDVINQRDEISNVCNNNQEQQYTVDKVPANFNAGANPDLTDIIVFTTKI